MFIGRMIIVILLFIILGLCAFLGKDMLEKKKLRDNREQAATSAESESTADTAGTESAAETETQAQKKRRRYHVSGRVKGKDSMIMTVQLSF